MGVVYFTSNASTGAGSLREAVTNAQPGDVVRPDETVFERGSTIEITLAATLTVDKNLTLDGGPFRVRLNGGGAKRCASVAANVTATFIGVDFVAGYLAGVGGGINAPGTTDVTFERCGFYGCNGTFGGGAYTTGTTRYFDCVFSGCCATESGGAIYVSKTAELNGVTAAGCVAANKGDSLHIVNGTATAVNAILCGSVGNPQFLTATGSVVGVASSSVGFVASPPDDLSVENWDANAWQSWNLRLLDDASGAPSPYRDSGDVGAMSRYDLDGNFRGRETNGVATCSPGAFETIQADLFWVGVDASGAGVVSPSFLTSTGWAESRFATVSGDVAPANGAALFIGSPAMFSDAPPDAAAITVGADGVAVPSAADVFLTLGAIRSATFGGTLSGLRLGDWAALTPSSLTIPAVEFIGVDASIAGVPVSVLDGVIFATSAQPAALATTGSGGWADVTANVTAVSVAPVDDRTVTVVITKSAADKAAFAQVSDDGGASWRAIPTSAAVDAYTVSVAPGADVTVRAAVADGWIFETVSTAPFVPVWTVTGAREIVVGVSNVFEVSSGGSNDGLNDYDFEDYGYL